MTVLLRPPLPQVHWRCFCCSPGVHSLSLSLSHLISLNPKTSARVRGEEATQLPPTAPLTPARSALARSRSRGKLSCPLHAQICSAGSLGQVTRSARRSRRSALQGNRTHTTQTRSSTPPRTTPLAQPLTCQATGRVSPEARTRPESIEPVTNATIVDGRRAQIFSRAIQATQ